MFKHPCDQSLANVPGSPSHLFAAEEELEKEWTRRHGAVDKATAVSGPDEDPTIKTKLNNDPNGSLSSENGHSDGHAGNDDDEELVVVIAGGMTSQLTYDGIDVCASRVAWEVSRCDLRQVSPCPVGH